MFSPIDLFTPDPNRPVAGAPSKPYKWLIIDGGGLVVTAWATHRGLERAEDRVRAGIYVFVVCLASLAKLADTDCKVVVCWDGPDNRAFRRGLHPWYKHGRGSVIDRAEVRVIMKELDVLLPHMGVAQIMMDGCEADDVVATVAREVADHDQTCLIFSDDKDYLQLIDDHIHLMRRSLRGVIMSPDQCRLMGIEYGQKYLTIKAIMGDYGDNIRGLMGVGERKAIDAIHAIPDLIDQLGEEIDLVGWEDLPKNVYNAFVRAGRKLISPLNPKDMSFATEFAKNRGMRAPAEIVLPDAICLKHAGIEILKGYRLVTMDDSMDYGKIVFPEVNVEAIPKALKRLDLEMETDLVSSIYALARLRNNSLVTPRATAVRAGAAIDDELAPPEDAF